MAITVNVILGWCRVAQASRAALSTNLMPDGLIDLADFTPEEVKDAAKSFARQPIEPFVISPHTMKRLVQLTLWVKDQRRLDINAEFPNGTPQAVFVEAIEAAQQRDKIRKDRQKSAEGLASVRIDPPLKGSAGWEAWMVSVETALTLAYGSKGVPLSYVIRAQEAPDLNGFGQQTWEESAVLGTPLAGLDYQADRMTVHLFILNNIGEESDAYTYIQPILGRNDGRRDIIALRERYDNDATVQTRVNEANKTWDMLVYKNERAMSFEEFCKKFQKALQHFDRAGRAKHNGDVIDWIWSHVQNSELSQTIAALKANQGIHARTPNQILQEIAKEIPNLSQGTSFQQRLSEVQTGSDFTFEGDAPLSGAFASDGKLFCGSYRTSQWFSDELSDHRSRILDLRQRHPELLSGRVGGGGGKDRGSPHRRNQMHKNKINKIKALEKQNEKLNVRLSALKAEEAKEQEETNDHAGDSFGGRASMSRRPT
jgi:phage tail protein X